jgi:hypothetical protein
MDSMDPALKHDVDARHAIVLGCVRQFRHRAG